MKNKVIALSLMMFGFSAVVQANGLVIVNKCDTGITYRTGTGSTYKIPAKTKSEDKYSFAVLQSTPTILAIKIGNGMYTPVETYLLKMAFQKKGKPQKDLNDWELCGILTVNEDSSFTTALGYRTTLNGANTYYTLP